MTRVTILLSTFNGERHLPQQLASLLAQAHPAWTLLWRDDGSTDGTVALMGRFAAGAGRGRCTALDTPAGRLGVAASFLALLQAVDAQADGAARGHAADAAGECAGDAMAVAFCDQDDVWLPGKLARGVSALAAVPPGVPALYCARQMLVDADGRPLGPSIPLRRTAEFPSALTQNVATGCTVMLNRAAVRLIGRSAAPSGTLHDWWSYLVVAASGGRLLWDEEPVVQYRQHPGNLVGAPRSAMRRAAAALRRGPGVFMGVFRGNVAALRAQPELLTPEARQVLEAIGAGLHGGLFHRIAALLRCPLRRQTWPETMLFRLWFLLG